MTKLYDFDEQERLGALWAKEQDAIWSHWFKIESVSEADDRCRGIDRRFYPRCKESRTVIQLPIAVQYKGDQKMNKSGNLSVEYLSRDTRGTTGGWLSTQANWISCYDVVMKECHVLDVEKLKMCFGVLWAHPRAKYGNAYDRKPCGQNEKSGGGRTWNLLVPLKDIMKVSGLYLGCVSVNVNPLAYVTEG